MNWAINGDAIVLGLSSWLSSLSWPVLILIIIWLFKDPIKELLPNLKSVEIAGFKFVFGDSIQVYSATDKAYYEVELKPPSSPGTKISETKIARLSDEEIEQSKLNALKRLDDDTKNVGYQRGKLRQLENGGYAIAWEVQASSKIGVKGASVHKDISSLFSLRIRTPEEMDSMLLDHEKRIAELEKRSKT